MKRSSNSAASINFNVNVPTDVIREYFDGLAKVEAAKASVHKSDTDWSSLLLKFAPLLVPLLSKSLGTEGLSNYINPETLANCASACANSENSDLTPPPVVISFVQKSSNSDSKKEETESSKKEETKESKKEETKDESSNKEDSSKKEDKKGKKPSYQESDIQFDLSSLGNANGGIADMMKMFAPMLQGFTSGFPANLQPKDSESSKSTEESDKEEKSPEENFVKLEVPHAD